MVKQFIKQKGRTALLSALFFCPLTLCAWQPPGVAQKSEQAKQLMAAGRFDDAIPLYRDLVKALPGNAGMLLNLALAQHMAGREQDAIPNFQAVLKLQPSSAPALFSLGAAYLAMGEAEQATVPLRKVLAVEPANHDARGMLAGALMDTGKLAESAEEFRKLSAASPNDARAWYGLGKAYEAIAATAFDRLQKANPTSPYVAALVADTRVQRRQYRSAFFFYREALVKLAGLHGLHASMAAVYRQTGHPDWAALEEQKERSLAVPDCKLHAAECQFVAGHDVQALSIAQDRGASEETFYWQAKAANELALQSFFRLGQLPPSIESHQLRADIARGQNQHLESVKEWRAALALSPGNPRLRHELAVSLFLAGDHQGALREAEELLKLDPRSPEMNFTAGDSLLRMEQPERAVPYLQAALAADPQMRAADASLGLALARQGKNVEAAEHLEKALELDDDGSLHYQFARVLQALGKADQARAAMAQYQEIVKRNQEQKDEVAREAQIAPPQP